MIYLRIISLLVLLVSTIMFPLWVSLVLFVVLVSFFPRFWESILTGVFLDTFYFSPNIFSRFSLGFFTLSFIVVVFFSEYFKRLVQTNVFVPRLVLIILGLGYFYLALLFF